MNYKVCVYGHANNEEENIEKWFSCVKEADCVCILDTGSTDSSMSILQKLASENSHFHFKQNFYKDVHFARMKNDTLAFAKSFLNLDTEFWIFVCLNLDEFLVAGEIKNLKNNWDESFEYGEILEQKDNHVLGIRVHTANPDWCYIRRVHEELVMQSRPKEQWKRYPFFIKFLHERDEGKKRGYRDLLKQTCTEDPFDMVAFSYYIQELNKNEDSEEYISANRRGLELFLTGKIHYFSCYYYSEITPMKAWFCLNLIDCEEDPKEKLKLINYVLQDMEEGYLYKINYIYNKVSEIYDEIGDFSKSREFLLKAINLPLSSNTSWFTGYQLPRDFLYGKYAMLLWYQEDYIGAYAYGKLSNDNYNFKTFYEPKYQEIVNAE